jgi:hypothetical protein
MLLGEFKVGSYRSNTFHEAQINFPKRRKKEGKERLIVKNISSLYMI